MNVRVASPPRVLRRTCSAAPPCHVLVVLWWWDERLLRGIARHGARQGWILDTRVRFANRLPIRHKYDGMIVFSGRDTTLLRMARAIRCPIVNLDQHRPIPGACSVCCDDGAVGQVAAEHLLACGLERMFHRPVYTKLFSFKVLGGISAFVL